jgi:hypothetical protein
MNTFFKARNLKRMQEILKKCSVCHRLAKDYFASLEKTVFFTLESFEGEGCEMVSLSLISRDSGCDSGFSIYNNHLRQILTKW